MIGGVHDHNFLVVSKAFNLLKPNTGIRDMLLNNLNESINILISNNIFILLCSNRNYIQTVLFITTEVRLKRQLLKYVYGKNN